MIRQTSRYVLRILGFLAENPGTRVQAGKIAEATGIPANYLSKILNQLRKQGVVDSEKGWGGGFEVRAAALRIPIGDVLQEFDGADPLSENECVFGFAKCDPDNPCPLHPYWAQARGTLDEMLRGTSVGELARSSLMN